MKSNEIDNILQEFYKSRQAQPDTSESSLETWVAKYPEAASELIDFEMYGYDSPERFDLDAETRELAATCNKIADRVFEKMMAYQSIPKVSHSPISGFIQAARAVNTSIGDLAKQLHISRSLLLKLDQRLIEPETIPSGLISRIAKCLQRTQSDVIAYFSLPPTLSASGAYRSKSTPTVDKRQKFDEALSQASDMTTDEKLKFNQFLQSEDQ